MKSMGSPMKAGCARLARSALDGLDLEAVTVLV
jgi:hypothetical protein